MIPEKLQVLLELKNTGTKKYVKTLLFDKGTNPLPLVKLLDAT